MGNFLRNEKDHLTTLEIHALWLHGKKPVLKKVDNLSVRNVIIHQLNKSEIADNYIKR